jgi:lantibiotic modifying enzyme
VQTPVDSERYRSAVQGVGHWLERVAVERGDGLAWPTQPTVADEAFPSLGWGGLGPILFFADAYRSVGEERYLDLANGGARWLRAALAERDEDLPPGLFTGLGGFAVVFDELYRASGDERLRDDLRMTFDLISERSTETEEGVHWQETTEILWGTAGLGCLLLTTGRRWIGGEADELATRAGDWLLAQAQLASPGVRWTLGEGPLRQRPSLRKAWFPNFAHGTAGIAFFLARLASVTGEARFLDSALEGARWVLSVCKTDEDTCAAQHHEPGVFGYEPPIGPMRAPDDHGPLYALGWCHGPPGLAWLFRELEAATGDPSWASWISRAANTVRYSGIAERREPGFWDNVGRCCGSAGVAELFLDLHTWREDPADLAFAQVMISDLLDRAVVDTDGMRWSNVEFRNDPPELPAETSFLQGASGIGCTLLRLSRHLQQDNSVIRWPHAPDWNQAQ